MKSTAPFALILLLAACGNPGDATDAALDAADERAAESGRIECAVEGDASFDRECTVERSTSEEGPILTLRHPSGGFRRLLVTNDGRGVVAADGADAAVVTILTDDRIEVAIAEDRYRLPATVKGAAQEQ
jgi:hypothetical protein